MSTIPDRRATRKASTPKTRPTKKAQFRKASFAYGYREVRKKLPNGDSEWVQAPLTLEDVLHPRLGDVHMLGDPHDEDCNYLKYVLKDWYTEQLSVVVFSDCGIYWDIPRLKHHSPDLSVIFGVKQRKDWSTFHVKTEKVWPSLIIEITSPDTRALDIKTKVVEYAKARVPYYVIADARDEGGRRKISLIAYRLRGASYKPMPADEHGRVPLGRVNLLLGVKVAPITSGDRLVLINPATNEEIGDYTAVNRARIAEAQARAAEAQAQAAQLQAQAAQAQAHAAAGRAEDEARARAAAEARIRELEAELKVRKRRK